jgi:hypothetical protein
VRQKRKGQNETGDWSKAKAKVLALAEAGAEARAWACDRSRAEACDRARAWDWACDRARAEARAEARAWDWALWDLALALVLALVWALAWAGALVGDILKSQKLKDQHRTPSRLVRSLPKDSRSDILELRRRWRRRGDSKWRIELKTNLCALNMHWGHLRSRVESIRFPFNKKS